MVNTVTPEVLWAQRSHKTDAAKNILYVSLAVPDVPPSSAKLDLTPTSISFQGVSTTKNVEYKVDLELYAEIDVENSKTHHSPRGVELVLRKKELKEEYWPRLLKESKKVHFLKTDFDKWVDEDEQDELDDDYSNWGGFGGDSGLGNIDFSKLGGGDAGAGDDGSDDDEDIPELEDTQVQKPAKDTPVGDSPTEEKPAEEASKPKIEEVS
ncbi:hypothetical protein VTO42DRAFT_2867 [Malbranchea cinnamomea]